MTVKHISFYIVLFLIGIQSIYAQYYDNGQDPASVRWRSLKTQYFHIIYPDYYEEKAQQIGRISDSLYPLVREEMSFDGKKKYKPIPLILHTQSSYSNAFSVWAPRRIEWYTGTPQSIYAQPWFEQLAIHETRHDLQMQRLGQSVTGVLTSIFGEHIIGAAVGLFVPRWFLEGDAVWAETKLSNTGRGRDADFTALMKAQLIEKGIYSYDKAAFGSYKDFVPNIYNFGYHLIAYTNEHVEKDLWQTGLDKAAQLKSLQPFNLSGNRKQLYKDAMNYWKDNHISDTVGMETNTRILTPNPKTYTYYYSPFFINDSTVYALKSDYKSAIRLVEANAEGDYMIKYFGNVYDGYLDYIENKLAWVESIPDKRWQTVTYTDLVVMNLTTGKNQKLSRKTHYFSPAFSNSGKQIAVIEIDSLDNYGIVILDSENGDILFESESLPYALSYPAWSSNDEEIYFIRLVSSGKSIHKISPETGTISEVLPNTYSNIRNLRITGNYLYFVSDQSGCSQVYALDLNTDEICMITHSKYGVGSYSFSPNGLEIVFSNYTANGYNIQKQAVDYSQKTTYRANNAAESIDLTKADSLFPSKRYGKLGHLVNFHSLSPIGNVVSDDLPTNPGITFLSQNLLSTSFIEAGYARDFEENVNQFFAGFTYKGFYPVLSMTHLLQGRKITSGEKSLTWNEYKTKYSISFPFSLYRYNHAYGISLKAHYEFTYQYNGIFKENGIAENRAMYNTHSGGIDVGFVHTVKKGFAELYPNWRQSVTLSYRKGFYNNLNSDVYAASGFFYFPGLGQTHSFNIYAGYQYKDEKAVTFSNLIKRPRGINALYLQNEATSFQFNYVFPFAHPDSGIPGVFYCKRLTANPFFDIINTIMDNYYSTGLEILGEWHFLRLDYPVSVGVRYAYLPQYGSSAWDFLFSVSF